VFDPHRSAQAIAQLRFQPAHIGVLAGRWLSPGGGLRESLNGALGRSHAPAVAHGSARPRQPRRAIGRPDEREPWGRGSKPGVIFAKSAIGLRMVSVRPIAELAPCLPPPVGAFSVSSRQADGEAVAIAAFTRESGCLA